MRRRCASQVCKVAGVCCWWRVAVAASWHGHPPHCTQSSVSLTCLGISTATGQRLTAWHSIAPPGPAALTAFQALKAARLQPGQRVLVHAAAGGVGSAAVQIAKAQGLEVGAAAVLLKITPLLSSLFTKLSRSSCPDAAWRHQ